MISGLFSLLINISSFWIGDIISNLLLIFISSFSFFLFFLIISIICNSLFSIYNCFLNNCSSYSSSLFKENSSIVVGFKSFNIFHFLGSPDIIISWSFLISFLFFFFFFSLFIIVNSFDSISSNFLDSFPLILKLFSFDGFALFSLNLFSIFIIGWFFRLVSFIFFSIISGKLLSWVSI